jgi:acyl-CoA oxidase
MCVANMIKVLPIAIRYSAVRKQFGNAGEEELPVIEYQMQQWRLFPYLAATYVIRSFADQSYMILANHVISGFIGEDKELAAKRGAEIHAISSSAKPLASWLARDAVQECREACGGHGYLRSAGIGSVRDDNDGNCTYEVSDMNLLNCKIGSYHISYIFYNESFSSGRQQCPSATGK